MTQAEKMEIITLVEQSPLSVKATVKEISIHRSTLYAWYKLYLQQGYDGLADKPVERRGYWNQLPPKEKEQIVTLALERPDLSCRELAWHITDQQGWFVSESTIYRILKSRGLVTTPAYRLMEASDKFSNPTTATNQLWQTKDHSRSVYLFQNPGLGLVLPIYRHGWTCDDVSIGSTILAIFFPGSFARPCKLQMQKEPYTKLCK